MILMAVEEGNWLIAKQGYHQTGIYVVLKSACQPDS